jgi:hypothetical protein
MAARQWQPETISASLSLLRSPSQIKASQGVCMDPSARVATRRLSCHHGSEALSQSRRSLLSIGRRLAG